MNVLHADAIAIMVVPYGKHSALERRVLFVEGHGDGMGRSPVLVEPFRVEIVVVVACGRHDVDVAVGNGNELEALLFHFHGVGVVPRPEPHQHPFAAHGRGALGVGEASPEHGSLAIALHQGDVAVGEVAEFLHKLLCGIAVFVGSDVHVTGAEHGVLTGEILLEQSVDKLVGLRVHDVEMVHAVVFRGYLGHVLCESQRVGRHVNLGYHLHAVVFAQELQVGELLLGVASVFGRESGIGVAFQSEGGLRLCPVVAEVLLEAVVVEMHLQGVHLVVGHNLDQIAQIGHRNELAAAVHHAAAQTVLWHVGHEAFGEVVLLAHLQQCACSPESARLCGRTDDDALAEVDAIAFLPERFVLYLLEDDIAFTGSSLT